MEIGPIGNRQKPVLQAESSSPKRNEPVKEEKQRDTLELSLAARQHLAELADNALTGELVEEVGSAQERTSLERNEKLRLVKERMESGFYQSNDVKNSIAERLAEQLFREDSDN